jgi:c-di-GMP-binding flagellar brake protein YcgR
MAGDAARYEGHSEKIADATRIAGLLRRIMASHALLTVRVGNEGETYNSAILEVNSEQNYVILDELNPRSGHERVAPSSPLTVRAIHDGIETVFTAAVGQVGTDNGVAYYRIGLPNTMHYYQRRSYYRATVGIAKEIVVQLHRDGAKVIKGELHDISNGGIGIRLRKELPPDIAEGETVPRCLIRFDDEDFICAVELRFVRQSSSRFKVLGARFLDLTPLQQAKVARVVADLDREARKRITAR